MSEEDDLINEQIEYYVARAPEYDEVFLRRGRYDRGEKFDRIWKTELRHVELEIERFRPCGRVLELACGTGWGTRQIVQHADEVVAVDASKEMLNLARKRVSGYRARFVEANLFEWEPEGQFDVIFFSFWLSHVPQERFNRFWDLVGRALTVEGRVFFVDNLPPVSATPEIEELRRQVQPMDFGNGVVIRRLNDGREFRLVKVHYEPEELRAQLLKLGWDIQVWSTGQFFLYGLGHRSRTSAKK